MVFVRTVKDLLQSLQINLWIELRNLFFTILVDLQCGQEDVCLIKLKPLSQLTDDVSVARKAISSAFSRCESNFMILYNSFNLATYYKIGQNFWTSRFILLLAMLKPHKFFPCFQKVVWLNFVQFFEFGAVFFVFEVRHSSEFFVKRMQELPIYDSLKFRKFFEICLFWAT